MKRESFQSRLGFLLVSAGCAIGIGNVWRFPYVVGQNGGGLFVLLDLIFLVLMGLPVLTMELAVGRASRKSAVLAYRALEKPKSKWHIHGWFAILGCYLLMILYHRFRLDAGLLCKVCHRHLPRRHGLCLCRECIWHHAVESYGNGSLYDNHRHCRLPCLQQGASKWP